MPYWGGGSAVGLINVNKDIVQLIHAAFLSEFHLPAIVPDFSQPFLSMSLLNVC